MVGELLQEDMLRDAVKWFKRYGNNAKTQLFDFFADMKLELEQTVEGAALLKKLAQGQSLTSQEKEQLKTQVVDVGKGIPLLGLIILPGGGIAVMVLAKLAKMAGVDLMPSAFRKPDTHRV